ncbi:hypothetical protein ACFV2H_46910 [Streptomyces sp. NPDC059629]|uniref:hypothetical protein n=1 Tax=Streptomyces sp. NPDC059629 TaxID=3346889 RepID=UPI00367E0B1B
MAILDRAVWHSLSSPGHPPPGAAAPPAWPPCTRSTSGGEDPHRATAISLPLVRGWAKDFLVEPLPDAGTGLTGNMAVDNRLLRLVRIPRRLCPDVTRACRNLMSAIITILRATEPTPIA